MTLAIINPICLLFLDKYFVSKKQQNKQNLLNISTQPFIGPGSFSERKESQVRDQTSQSSLFHFKAGFPTVAAQPHIVRW